MKYVIYLNQRISGKEYFTGKIKNVNGADVAIMSKSKTPKLYRSYGWGIREAKQLNIKCKHQGPFGVETYASYLNRIFRGGTS